MHQKDKLFLDKAVSLIETDITFKTSETNRRIKCIIVKPPRIGLDTIKQIQMMKRRKKR